MPKNDYIVLFVEGETEKEFYEVLFKYYLSSFKLTIGGYRIVNIKGISRFETKVSAKLKYEILPKHSSSTVKVFCCYDTDVFELAQKPPTNWEIVRKKVKELGISSFNEVKAIRMIEDWFLKDIDGLCKFLNIKVPKRLHGGNAIEKIKGIFKMGKKPKIYQKGSYTHKFVGNLNIAKIRGSISNELQELETILGISIKKK